MHSLIFSRLCWYDPHLLSYNGLLNTPPHTPRPFAYGTHEYLNVFFSVYNLKKYTRL